MQDNFLNRQKTQAILDSRPQGVDIPTALKELSNQGFTIEGYNDKPVQSAISNAASIAKSAVGGLASGIGGAALTAEDYLMRKGVEKFGSPELQQRIAQTPSLNEQFNAQYGANENPAVFRGAQLAGEVGSLAIPAGEVGTLAKLGTKSIGAGEKTATLVKAGTEGAAFTAGQGLAENKKQSLNDYATNIGLNVAIPGAGIAAQSIGENIPARIINSLIKPLQKDFAYGKNPGKSVAELVPPANNFEDLITNIKTTLNDVGNRIGSVVSQSPNLKQIDLSYTLKPIDDAIAKASQAKGTNATLIQRLQTVKQDLVDNINNGIDPQSYKGLVGDLTKWTGSVSDDALVNKSLKQVYGTTKQSMDDVLSKELTPEQFAQYKADSEAYGNLLSAKNAAEHRDKLVQRQDLISFGAKNSAMLAGLATAVASGGSGIPALLAGMAGAGIDKALATPAFKTRVASLLSKLAPKEVNTFFDAVPTAKTLFNENEIKNFVSDVKTNTKGQMNRGMINFSEFIPKLESDLSLASNAKSKDLKLSSTEDIASKLNDAGIDVGVVTDKNADNILNIANEFISMKKNELKNAEMNTPAVKMMQDRTKKKVVSSIEQEKLLQLEKINKLNPMTDKYHTGIRSVNDIKTFKEAISDPESFAYPDFTKSMAENASKNGKITIYSSKPLDNNVAQFVTPSKMNATDYAGNGKVYSKIVNIDDIAWINSDEGQLLGNVKKAVSPLEQEAKKYKSAEEFIKAQGNPVYHGTTKNIVDNVKIGSETENPATLLGFFTTKDKNLAKEYGNVNEIFLSEKPKTAIIPETKTTDQSRTELWKFVVKDNFGTDFPDSNELNKFKDSLFGKYSDINYGTPTENAKFRINAIKNYLIEKGYNSIEMNTGFKNGTGRSLIVIKDNVAKTKSQLTDIWDKAHGK